MGCCQLPVDDIQALRGFYASATGQIKLGTAADVLDTTGALLCRGSFAWSIKR